MTLKLYKYLPSKYLESFLSKGEFLFRSLSYFQDFEDEQVRGDRYDGALKYTGVDGLEINNKSTGSSFKVARTFKSKVDAESVFVFSTSQRLSADLAKEFKSDVCIEFLDPVYVISKLRNAISRRKRIKPNKLFHREVIYYSEEEAPGIKWEFPDQIAMRKLHSFSKQEEYRFMFSINNALDFGKTSQEIQAGEKAKVQRVTPYPDYVLKIGKIRRRCKIHEFT